MTTLFVIAGDGKIPAKELTATLDDELEALQQESDDIAFVIATSADSIPPYTAGVIKWATANDAPFDVIGPMAEDEAYAGAAVQRVTDDYNGVIEYIDECIDMGYTTWKVFMNMVDPTATDTVDEDQAVEAFTEALIDKDLPAFLWNAQRYQLAKVEEAPPAKVAASKKAPAKAAAATTKKAPAKPAAADDDDETLDPAQWDKTTLGTLKPAELRELAGKHDIALQNARSKDLMIDGLMAWHDDPENGYVGENDAKVIDLETGEVRQPRPTGDLNDEDKAIAALFARVLIDFSNGGAEGLAEAYL